MPRDYKSIRVLAETWAALHIIIATTRESLAAVVERLARQEVRRLRDEGKIDAVLEPKDDPGPLTSE